MKPSEADAASGKAPKTRVPSERMQRKLAATRQAIVQAALDLFASEPYRDVTIAKIMQRAGYSVGTFYSFFSDKEDLIISAARDLMASANSFMTDIPADLGPRETIAYVMHGAAEVIARHQVLYDLFSTHVAASAEVAGRTGSRHAQGSLAMMRSLVEKGQAQGAFREDADPDVAAELLQSCLRSSNDRTGASFVAAVDAKVGLVLDAIAVR